MNRQYETRQLPMGAGYCQWGGFTDGMYVIYMERNTSHRDIAQCFEVGLFF